MFCSNCGCTLKSEGKFCAQCGQARDTAIEEKHENVTKQNSGVVDVKPKKSIKSFLQYKTSKGKEWNSKVKGGKQKNGSNSQKEQDVLIFIRLLEWNGNERTLKMKRGKKVGMRISNTATSSVIHEKAEEKWRAYYSNLYNANQPYLLVYEDGQIVNCLPGTEEPFSLKRYHEESGIDYNRINLFLCTMDDHNHFLMREFDSDSEDSSPPIKCPKSDNSSANVVDKQIKLDENLARQLESRIEWENMDNKESVAEQVQDLIPLDEVVVIDNNNTQLKTDDLEQEVINNTVLTDRNCIEELRKRVDSITGQFFIVARRGSNLSRCLNLWQRESKRTKADKTLRVHFTGEDGIDSGAMAKEFLAKVISDIGNSIFPAGSPVDSTHNVQNGYFQTCGEIVAVSLAQGGPPPCFLHECVYKTMVNPKLDLKNLDETDITPEEKIYLDNLVMGDVAKKSSDIIEHGYTGKIDQDHINDIRRSIVVSIVSKRQLYLGEFMKGLELYGLAEMMKENPEMFKQHFIIGKAQQVDANFVFSLMKPRYSVDGSIRKEIEEGMMDNFQDFLMSLEDNDEKQSGYSEAVSWNYLETGESSEPSEQEAEEFQLAEITVSGVLGWLTGQKHRPINGDPLNIFVNFDHDCLVRQPNHTICFPCIGACGRELTLLVSHMKDGEDFQRVFMTALSKGQAFSRP
ncbi:uncharacterized protein LOC114519707 [Dendronephthya gigantea]|uniref:uncharacterized protein LOC114519707 n=1 Tax=Dendronephthya gigantea TaxID=151771 RepID=UPI00106D572C|nr:uncharacterized protein LOC114519707 [Dendronephthya gigantea]